MENGWYWVALKTSGTYEVALYENGLWYRAGVLQERTDRDHYFSEIGPRLLSPKDQRTMNQESIAAHAKLMAEWAERRIAEMEA
jgi:hypothetical protein